MAAQGLTRFTDLVISELAGRQHGVVARWQLLAHGITRHQIGMRLKSSRLHEVHRGVYLVGHTAPPPLAREMAALLACGPEAVLSHRSAAAFWELLPYPAPADVCVTVPPRKSPKRSGIEIHRTDLARRDWMVRDALRITSPARTIFDLASGDDYELERVVAEAQYRRLVSERQLCGQIDRNPHTRCVPTLRGILDIPGGPQRTRSPAERQILHLLRTGGFSGYELNARIHGYEVDVVWREIRFAMEVDGYDGHAGRTAFERDRLKIATLQSRGLTVMPATGRQIRDDPDGVTRRLRRAIRLAEQSRLRRLKD